MSHFIWKYIFIKDDISIDKYFSIISIKNNLSFNLIFVTKKNTFSSPGSSLVLLLSSVDAKHKESEVFKFRYVRGDLYIKS